jgi:hypothetical protein
LFIVYFPVIPAASSSDSKPWVNMRIAIAPPRKSYEVLCRVFPMMGGSVPLYDIAAVLQVPVIGLPELRW